MNNSQPLVSCVIPSYKRNDMISRAIDSVLAQTYSNIEIIIVDDNEKGSEYGAALEKVVKAYNNERVKLLTQPSHINGAAARNFGVKHAEGEYIAFLDDDDEWLPTKIEKQIDFLNRNPEYEGVTTLSSLYTNGRLVCSQEKYDVEDLQYKVFLRKVGIGTPTFLASRESLVKMGCFDEHLLRHQDLQLFVAFLDSYKIGLVPEVLVKIHSDSAINRPNVEKLIQIKQDYFKSVKEYLDKYSPREQKRIMANHYFEVAYIALKEKKISTFIKYLFKAGSSLQAIKDVLGRLSERV